MILSWSVWFDSIIVNQHFHSSLEVAFRFNCQNLPQMLQENDSEATSGSNHNAKTTSANFKNAMIHSTKDIIFHSKLLWNKNPFCSIGNLNLMVSTFQEKVKNWVIVSWCPSQFKAECLFVFILLTSEIPSKENLSKALYYVANVCNYGMFAIMDIAH